MDMNIQLEASVVERLQKLRQWQLEQQEKLMKQQQIQREMLSHEQDLIYKALSLSVHDNDVVEDTENTPVIYKIDTNETMPEALILEKDTKTTDNSDKINKEEIAMNENDAVCENYKEGFKEPIHIAAIVNDDRNSIKNYCSGILSQKEQLSDDLLIEGIKPLSQNNKMPNECVSFDDIPLPSPKKDFRTLLEEKLKREAVMQNTHANTKTQMKRPFLKKGKGLSRFKISTNSRPPAGTTRKCTLTDIQHTDKSNKNKKSIVQKDLSSSNVTTENKTRRLNLKTVPLPRSKIATKSRSITSTEQNACNSVSDRPTYLPEINISDLDSKVEKEMEEVRIFELLEEKAENSSFCSTSSTVLAFLQQSTPFKVKKGLNRATYENNITASIKQQNGKEDANDTLEQQPTIHRTARVENAKSDARTIKQSGIHKHSRTSALTSGFYWDTIVDNTQDKSQKHSTIVDQALQSKEMHRNYLEDHGTSCDTRIVALSSSDEESNIRLENNRNNEATMCDNEAETNHHVRFAEYNEYRTIDLSDTSNTMSKSPLRNYLEQEDWHERSGDISSDIEERQINYEEQVSSRKMINDNEVIVSPEQLFSQQNTAKNSYYRAMKTLSVPEEDNALNYKDGSVDENKEEINQISDEEMQRKEETEEEEEERQSILSSLSSSSLSDTQRREYVLRNEPVELAEKIMYLNARDIERCPSEDRTNQTSTFKPELLKSRLLELEQEIDIFRKESSALLLQRRKLQEEHVTLRKEYTEKEKAFEEDKRRIQNQLEEEKKKLAREKAAIENRIRDAQEKAKQNKIERQRAQNLQEELDQLRDELSTKESRWNAAESRYKSELRALRVENSKLKQEIANLQNIKKTNMKNIRKNMAHGQVTTRSIGQINKRLTAISAKETSVKRDSRDSSDVCICNNVCKDEHKDEEKNEDGKGSIQELITQAIHVNSDFELADNTSINKIESRQAGIGSQLKCNEKCMKEDVVKKKRHLYEILLKDATSDFAEGQGGPYIMQDVSDLRQQPLTMQENSNLRSNRVSRKNSDKSNATNDEDLYVTKNIEYCTDRLREVNQNRDENSMKVQNREQSEEKNLSPASYTSSNRLQTAGINTKETKQIQFTDGHVEYWYPNGNVKKIFPEQGITKMIYYNGDVRETDKDGRMKYFYATTCTWHITTPDGVDILEFSKYVRRCFIISLAYFDLRFISGLSK
jgi:centromere protein J